MFIVYPVGDRETASGRLRDLSGLEAYDMIMAGRASVKSSA